MADTYFALLPYDLTLELSLYLNYRDTCLSCAFLRCDQPTLWINKIRWELGYSNEFIQQYVYNSQTNMRMTLLPLNEKYLELKSRKTADFGSEFYKDIDILINFSSRITDFPLAIELTKYFIRIHEYQGNEPDTHRRIYQDILKNALSRNNMELARFAYNKLSRIVIPPNATKTSYFITKGIYEYYPKGNPDLFAGFNIKENEIVENAVKGGLANGGYLKELLERPQPISTSILWEASYRGQRNIIEHFNLLSIEKNLDNLIEYGHVDLLPNIEQLTPAHRSSVLKHLIRYGYLELIEKYTEYLTKEMIGGSIVGCLRHNHLDMLNYLLLVNEGVVKLRLKGILDSFDLKFDRLTIDTIIYLTDHGLLTFDNMTFNRLQQIVQKAKKYNPNVYEYFRSVAIENFL